VRALKWLGMSMLKIKTINKEQKNTKLIHSNIDMASSDKRIKIMNT